MHLHDQQFPPSVIKDYAHDIFGWTADGKAWLIIAM